MSKKNETSKVNPLGVKAKLKIDASGRAVFTEDTKEIYKETRPEIFPKGIELAVHTHQAQFAAGIIDSVTPDIIKAFKANPKLNRVVVTADAAYNGNKVTATVNRSTEIRNVATGETSVKLGASRVSIKTRFKTVVRPAQDSLAEAANKAKIKPMARKK